MNSDDDFKALAPIEQTPVAPAIGIAAMALNLALRYHDTTVIKDGTMYQQYKMEGRNIRELNLDTVFETAILMEIHLIGANERVAKLVVDALAVAVEDEETEPPDAGAGQTRGGTLSADQVKAAAKRFGEESI